MVERSDHERRLIRAEAGVELAAPAVKRLARKRLLPTAVERGHAYAIRRIAAQGIQPSIIKDIGRASAFWPTVALGGQRMAIVQEGQGDQMAADGVRARMSI